MAEISFHDSLKFFMLLDIQKFLRRKDFEKLDLVHLGRLAEEVDQKITKFQEDHKGQTF